MSICIIPAERGITRWRPILTGMALFALCAGLAGCSDKSSSLPEAGEKSAKARSCTKPAQSFVKVAGGSFAMGQEDVYAEEGPIRQVSVDPFWIDTTEVTVGDFAQFVNDTGYVTVAEKPVDPAQFGVPKEQIPPDMLLPGSAVFTAPAVPSRNYADWWEYRPGANWRKPLGPDGPDAARDRPVVHLAYDDMEAYAKWRGGRLPTEAEWEYAARAGSGNYTDQPSEANSWQGVFPVKDFETDGFGGVAPVGCYEPNAWGLYDMVGNVWEVTSDFYAPNHDPNRPSHNPTGPAETESFDPANPHFPSRVMKGGSYLCAPNYCQRYRPAARTGRDPEMGSSNVGFRLVYDQEPHR